MADTWTSALSHLECGRCGTWHDADKPQNLCACGTPLLVRYDLDRVAGTVSTPDIAGRPNDLWRYRELLPVRDRRNVVSLGEGMTPILPLGNYGTRIGVPNLLVKDEGLLPTGSFKARGAAVGVSKAHELGIERITMPTNGNAGAAWATYAARAGMASLIVMPADAPPITRMECAMAGARLHIVDGLIGDAGRIAAQAVADGWFNSATLKEPYRIEGKKTMGLEIVEQLGWRMPDVIVYPTGGGVGLIGIRKAPRRRGRTRKSFGDVHVLRGGDLTVDRGEVLAIIGPSGGGKSTLRPRPGAQAHRHVLPAVQPLPAPCPPWTTPRSGSRP